MGDWKERYKELLERFSKRQRYIMLGSALAILIAIIGVSAWYGNKPDMVPLFTNMETKDAGEVAAKLKEAKIEYEVQETRQGTTIMVPSRDVHNARLDLSTQGLPRGNKGFEIFDDSKLGVTEFQNKVNYLQALQGELTRTIEQIAAVEKARVHIVLPEDSLYKKNEKPATASIMLHLRPNMELSKKEVKGIVNLAANSVQGLKPENITVHALTLKRASRMREDQDEIFSPDAAAIRPARSKGSLLCGSIPKAWRAFRCSTPAKRWSSPWCRARHCSPPCPSRYAPWRRINA